MQLVSLCRRRERKRLLFGGSAFILCETLPWQKALGGTLLQPTMRWPRCGLQVSTVREAQPECGLQSSNAVDARILSLNLCYCISLLLFKTSFSKSLFCFRFVYMCEVHLPKSKQFISVNDFWFRKKIDSVLQMQFIWKDQFVIVYRPQLYLV